MSTSILNLSRDELVEHARGLALRPDHTPIIEAEQARRDTIEGFVVAVHRSRRSEDAESIQAHKAAIVAEAAAWRAEARHMRESIGRLVGIIGGAR